MSELIMNLGHGFGLRIPPDMNIFDLKAEIEFKTRDEYSSQSVLLRFPAQERSR